MSIKLEEMQVGVAEVVDYSKINGSFSEALKEVVKRKITVEEAKKRGVEVSEEELQQAADIFRTVNKLNTLEGTETWLKERGLTVEALENYLETNLYIYKLKDELVKEVDQEKYYSAPIIRDSLRHLAYQEWLTKLVK